MKAAHLITAILSLMCLIPDSIAGPARMTVHSGWEFRQARLSNWYPATVPGTVHTDLMDNGIIEDPYIRLNERGVQWVDKEDWIYRTTFDVPEEIFSKDNIRIHFFGLDTYADVRINGSLVLSADNMFREWTADVKDILEKTGNSIEIYFHSPIKVAMPMYDALPYHYEAWNDQAANGGLIDKKLSPFTRKAGYHYGWDWGPRLVTSGIWRKVEIEAWDTAMIENVQFIPENVSSKSADVRTFVEITSDRQTDNAVITVSDRESGTRLGSVACSLEKGLNRVEIDFRIRNPRLWWCNGMGRPEMYTLTTDISVDGKAIDSRTEKTGIRSVVMEKVMDGYGRSLRLILNGEPVFCKGANYIPCDNFLPRITDETYLRTVKDAADVNMNMLRVWGGGIYEDDRFYNCCDSLGIMVWQDFMFACAVYPAKGEFLENIRQEAICNVRRLRNHPCIVYWCGNNENQDSWLGGWIYDVNKVDPKYSEVIWKEYEQQYYRTLADVVREYGSGIGYQPTSPFADYGVPSNDHEGDRHYWEVWHGKKPISEYNNQRSRFFSEYGFQSFPCIGSVRKFATEERDMDISSEVMMSHQRGGEHANHLIETYLLNEYHKPEDFASFLYTSQILQGDAIKTAIEAHRRDKGYCWGSLYWQHNDCWPAASWSSRDWYGTWKALHYFARKAFDDVLVSAVRTEDSLEVYVISDRTAPVNGKTEVKAILLTGESVSAFSTDGRIDGNSSQKVMTIPLDELLHGESAGDVVITLSFDAGGRDRRYDNICFLLKQKEIAYPECHIGLDMVRTEDGYAVTVSSDKFARGVYLYSDVCDLHFSDNFFDLLPGESRTVTVRTDASLSENDLKYITLADSY